MFLLLWKLRSFLSFIIVSVTCTIIGINYLSNEAEQCVHTMSIKITYTNGDVDTNTFSYTLGFTEKTRFSFIKESLQFEFINSNKSKVIIANGVRKYEIIDHIIERGNKEKK